LDTTNLAATSQVMDRFASKLEDLEVMERTVNEAMDTTTSKLSAEDEVRSLIQEVADENNLQLKELLPGLAEPRPSPVPAQEIKAAPAKAAPAAAAAQ